MNILAIPVQSISDLITNSSSEVFILDTGKTCEEVNYDINRVLAEEEDDTVDCIDWKTLHRHSYWFKNALWDISKEFLKSYDGPRPTVWEISKAEDVRRLDGKVLVVSNDDNSIPYDTWDKINSLFNGWNIHLG